MFYYYYPFYASAARWNSILPQALLCCPLWTKRCSYPSFFTPLQKLRRLQADTIHTSNAIHNKTFLNKMLLWVCNIHYTLLRKPQSPFSLTFQHTVLNATRFCAKWKKAMGTIFNIKWTQFQIMDFHHHLAPPETSGNNQFQLLL